MKDAKYLRRGRQILDAPTREVVENYPSINAAKRRSRVLQGARRERPDGTYESNPSVLGNGVLRLLTTR